MIISRAIGEGYTREGTSCDVRYLRIGRDDGRWRLEFSKSFVNVRMGDVYFTAGFEWADD